MTPEEDAMLSIAGRRVVVWTTNTMERTVLWGIHGALTFAAIQLIRKRGISRLLTKFLVTVLVTLVVVNSWILIHRWIIVVLMIKTTLRNIGTEIPDRLVALGKLIVRLETPLSWLDGITGFIFFIGDVVVIVRGYVLWMRSKLWFAIPIFLVFASFALAITTNTLYTLAQSNANANSDPISICAITSIACSIAANFTVTVMIGAQAFSHRMAMQKVNVRSNAWAVMLHLTETGAVYFVIQLLALILNLLITAPYTRLDYFQKYFHPFYVFVALSYPALVILLVSQGQSSNTTYDSSGMYDAGTRITFRRNHGDSSAADSRPPRSPAGQSDTMFSKVGEASSHELKSMDA